MIVFTLQYVVKVPANVFNYPKSGIELEAFSLITYIALEYRLTILIVVSLPLIQNTLAV